MTAMRPYPIPANDGPRSRTIDAMALQDRRGDPFFAHVTDLAKGIFDAPIAFLSLMGIESQSFLHCNGADADGTPRSMSLCAFTVAARRTIVLHDTHLDPRSLNHPVVTGAYRLRFSASAPVILSSGFCIGTLCAVDMVPHDPATPRQIAALESLAAMTARFYEAPGEPDPSRAAALRRIVEDAQDEFLSLIGHELRTPLNGIHGIAQLLDTPDEDTAEMVAAITGSAELLNDIVESILAFTEMRSGDIALVEGPVDLAELLRRTVADHAAMLRLRGKHCDTAAVPSALNVTGDRAKLELAFSCIATNFIAHGGCNAVMAARRMDDGAVEVTITDDGEGISPEREARIWEAFGTGKSVRERAADGIGLGLPLTRRIVDLHGGELDLVHAHPGVTARIRLPAWRVSDEASA